MNQLDTEAFGCANCKVVYLLLVYGGQLSSTAHYLMEAMNSVKEIFVPGGPLQASHTEDPWKACY